MTPESMFWLVSIACALGFGVFIGTVFSDAAWAHRTRVREMLHKEKLMLLEQRAKMLEVKP